MAFNVILYLFKSYDPLHVKFSETFFSTSWPPSGNYPRSVAESTAEGDS